MSLFDHSSSPGRGTRDDVAWPITGRMPSGQSLIAVLVAAISGYAVVRTGRTMMGNGIELQDGGGWAALLIIEVCVSLAAVCVALA